MKVLFVSILALGAVSSFASADPYIGGAVGAALGVPGRTMGVDDNENIYGTEGGSTLHLDIHAGLKGSTGVGGELGLEWGRGSKQLMDRAGSAKTESAVSGIYLTPALVVATKGTFAPYAKFGMVVGFAMSKIEDNTVEVARVLYKTRTEYTGGNAMGFLGAVGAEIRATPRAGIVLEIQGRNVVWTPEESETGVVTHYDDSPSASQARKASIDLSSLQLRLGLNYSL